MRNITNRLNDPKIIGVSGIDFTINLLKDTIEKLYPECKFASNSLDCI